MNENTSTQTEPEDAEGVRSTDLLALSQKWRSIADKADEEAFLRFEEDPVSEIGICHEQSARTFRHCADTLESLANVKAESSALAD